MPQSNNASAPQSETPFTISRTFNAPREKVFAALTDLEHLKHWWGPKGFKVISCTTDLRPGGVFHYGMKSPAGDDVWGKWIFREVVVPERLVFVALFSDKAGGVTRHPYVPGWPLETLSTMELIENGNRTVLTVTGIPINATAEERKIFADARGSMQQGWTGTLDQLAGYLSTT